MTLHAGVLLHRMFRGLGKKMKEKKPVGVGGGGGARADQESTVLLTSFSRSNPVRTFLD
jgi:hypothetical protein